MMKWRHSADTVHWETWKFDEFDELAQIVKLKLLQIKLLKKRLYI